MTVLKETYWEEKNRTKMGIYLTDSEMNFLLGSVSLPNRSTVLDIGAGAGRFSIPLARKGMHVSSIDLSSHGLKRLRLKNKDVDVILTDARGIPLRSNIVDAIVMVELLDCVLELDRALAECARILKPGGSFFFTFGNEASLKGKLKKLRGLPYLHSYREVLDNLEAVGFAIVKREGFNWLPFDRISDSPLVPFTAKIERRFGLRKLVSASPWIMVYAIKVYSRVK